jgi:arginyl-tRNA synthetase
MKNLSGSLSSVIFDLYNINDSKIVLTTPKDLAFGDITTNIAMILASQLKRKPLEIAQEIVSKLEDPTILKVEVKAPGFINIFLKKDLALLPLVEIFNNGLVFPRLGLSYNVEFVSANPTGHLHLGHARQAALGDSICRILDKIGYDTTREYYINDAGNQIENLGLSIRARYQQFFDPNFKMEEDYYQGLDIITIAQEIRDIYQDKFYNDFSSETLDFYKTYGKKKELEGIQKVLERFRVRFDIYSSELEIREKKFPELALEKLRSLGYLYESEGATFFRTTLWGDDKDRVVIKSDGSYTYLTPDIAYHIQKLSRGYDYLVDLLGADHHGYILRMQAAIQALGHSNEKLNIVIVQLVRLIREGLEVRMSKRTGNAITINDLVDEVGVDAARYFFVCKSPNSHLDFDLDVALKQNNDNPIYYIEYAHARICQILKKTTIQPNSNFILLTDPKELELIKCSLDYKNILVEAGKTTSPHKLVNYLLKLTSYFHTFYNDCKVNDDTNIELSQARLGLCQVIKYIISDGLSLIGVEAYQQM